MYRFTVNPTNDKDLPKPSFLDLRLVALMWIVEGFLGFFGWWPAWSNRYLNRKADKVVSELMEERIEHSITEATLAATVMSDASLNSAINFSVMIVESVKEMAANVPSGQAVVSNADRILAVFLNERDKRQKAPVRANDAATS